MSIKVGEIPYLNCAPFCWDRAPLGGDARFEWAQFPPRELGRLARIGQLDAAAFSLVDAFALEDRFEPLGNFVIAVANEAKSVLLFSKRPIERLGAQTIGLTQESSTSTRLLHLILTRRYQVHARYEMGFRDSDEAQLYIGNPALQAFEDGELRRKFARVYDLGTEWRQWKNLPFVFARWMVRKSAAAPEKRALHDWLERNVAGCDPDHANALQAFSARFGQSFSGGREYLAAFRYRAGAEELKAIAAFRTLLDDRHRSAPTHSPVGSSRNDPQPSFTGGGSDSPRSRNPWNQK